VVSTQVEPQQVLEQGPQLEPPLLPEAPLIPPLPAPLEPEAPDELESPALPLEPA
jgi:hypothetical protein